MMADSPELRQDAEEYWRAAREFVRVLIAELNDSLKESGVWKGRRRQICTRFAFGFASYLDQQWMKAGGKTRYPLLCFTTSFLDVDVALTDLPSILCPHRSVELHAMVSDEVDWYFREMKEDGKAVITGSVGEETEDTDEVPEKTTRPEIPCWTCQGTGRCFCLRKGSGDPVSCSRCQGTGQCRHCHGTGRRQ